MELGSHTIGAQPCAVKSKACTKCGVVKPLEEFSNHKLHKDGKSSQCKVCAYKVTRRWQEANPERHRESSRRYECKNREKLIESKRKWNEANREKVRESVHRSRRKNPVANRARVAVYSAVKDGKLKRPPYCTHCYKPCKPQAHHYDYTKPLDVWWLCPLCHGKVHRIDA